MYIKERRVWYTVVSMSNDLHNIARRLRRDILMMSTAAGSGHPTSSLSAVELMAVLLYGGFFKYDIKDPDHPDNDRLIFSKGHASPLFYALWAAAEGSGIRKEELATFRQSKSRLEGHPTLRLPYTEAATGSLGQGLSIGVGMALAAKTEKLDYRTYVLLGDSEMAEGSNWEAMQLAARYRLDNLVAILDVNRLGQTGETMYGHELRNYAAKAEAFGWKVVVVRNGHSLWQVRRAYAKASRVSNKPVMVIARTVKGKGVSFLENKEGWHGRTLAQVELEQALEEIGEVDYEACGTIVAPTQITNYKKQKTKKFQVTKPTFQRYKLGECVATREAYGEALAAVMKADKRIVALDAEVSNSTKADAAKKKFPERFFEMYIAEQNMVGAALGFARRGYVPFASTFAAFLTRAHDQIRMAQYSAGNIKLVGSHAGVSIGEDGASQMGLEDIAMLRSVRDSVVLYPCDAVSTAKCVEAMAKHEGLAYLRTTRGATPVIYNNSESFKIGGSKVVKRSKNDVATIVAAGITLHEALAAYEELQQGGINVRVIDCYSVKPLDEKTLRAAAAETGAVITVEDHYRAGGLGEAVAAVLSGMVPVEILAVGKEPRSGTPAELLQYEGIGKDGIVRAVKKYYSR